MSVSNDELLTAIINALPPLKPVYNYPDTLAGDISPNSIKRRSDNIDNMIYNAAVMECAAAIKDVLGTA